MIVFDSTVRSLTVVLTSAKATNDCPFVVAYADISQTTFGLSNVSANTGTTNGTTVVTVLSAPAASTSRQLKYFSCFNADTAAIQITVQYADNSNNRTIIKPTLQVGERLDFDSETGWVTFDASGDIKQGFSFPVENANTMLAGPTTGSPATSSFRTLVGADLPNPSSSTLGGVQSFAAVTSQWIRAISTAGVPTASQPNFSDIAGTVAASQLPNPSASTLGGVESYAAVTHQFLTSISTSGVPASAQPAFTDISGTASTGQIPNLPASQITSGQLALARGGTHADLSGTGGASQVLKQVSAGADVTVGQLAFTDISGSVAASQLPNPSASTLGGVESLAAVTSKWINTISTSGVPSATQPAFTDISGTASTGQIPNLAASKITSGQIALAQGGTNADLSATGGTSQVLKQVSSGAAITVAQLASTDLSDVSAPSWTPADVSGAGLTLTINSSSCYRIGKFVYLQLDVTYPTTSDVNAASISLPVTCISKPCALTIGRNSLPTSLGCVANGSNLQFPSLTNAGLGGNANVTLSGGRLVISGVYQAA